MVSKEKAKRMSGKKWFLVTALIIILLLALVYLSRRQPGKVQEKNPKGEKILPGYKARESFVPVKKENETREQYDYRVAVSQNTISAYQGYLDEYPSGNHVEQAENKIKELTEMPEAVRIVAAKASIGIKVRKNEKGLWEADCGDDIIMIYIPPGKFIMGTNNPWGKWNEDEKPAHEVYLDGYWMGKYEITWDQFDQFCAETSKEIPDYADAGWGRGKRPVIFVSRHDASAYCKWLSVKTGLHFKLPTEAQWEKAARGTNGQLFPWGNQWPNEELANFGNDVQAGITKPVGSYPLGESPYGLIDMAGNVWEWCTDWYGPYSAGPQKNPMGPQSGEFSMLRGGSWHDEPQFISCTNRYPAKPSFRGYIEGFRLCLEK